MSMSTITIRVNEELKDQAEEVFESIGINTTTAFVIFMKSVIREGKIPFELKADPFYRRENTEELKRRVYALDNGGEVVVKTMDELRAMENE